MGEETRVIRKIGHRKLSKLKFNVRRREKKEHPQAGEQY